MPRVTLLNLETLCCIAKLGTFAAAAQMMHASQPAISARVRDMETAMGVTLFRRHGRRMELTTQGRELVQMVDPLIKRLQGAVGSMDTVSHTTGLLRIGVGEYAAVSWFPMFMARLRERMPRVNWQVEVDLTAALTDKLSRGKLDLALLAGPLVGTDVHATPVGRVRMVWVSAPPLMASPATTLSAAERLRSQVIWSLSPSSATYAMTQSALHALGLSAQTICTCNHTVALLGMVTAGAGVALLPEIMVRGHLAKAELVLFASELPMPEVEFVAAWHGASDQHVVQQMVALAQQCSSFDRLSVPSVLPALGEVAYRT
jgi:DNA-binding transcriptional LysR family regulator